MEGESMVARRATTERQGGVLQYHNTPTVPAMAWKMQGRLDRRRLTCVAKIEAAVVHRASHSSAHGGTNICCFRPYGNLYDNPQPCQ